MNLLSLHKKARCQLCSKIFSQTDELIHHVKDEHNKFLKSCPVCKQPFFNEKDRLHHLQEEKRKKMDIRRHK